MLFKDLFLLAGIGIVLVTMNWRLALAAFTVLPLVVLASWWFSRRVRDVFRRLRSKSPKSTPCLPKPSAACRSSSPFAGKPPMKSGFGG
jgi:ABC-type multidrug transport system fused ATPase/permease subunit